MEPKGTTDDIDGDSKALRSVTGNLLSNLILSTNNPLSGVSKELVGFPNDSEDKIELRPNVTGPGMIAEPIDSADAIEGAYKIPCCLYE